MGFEIAAPCQVRRVVPTICTINAEPERWKSDLRNVYKFPEPMPAWNAEDALRISSTCKVSCRSLDSGQPVSPQSSEIICKASTSQSLFWEDLTFSVGGQAILKGLTGSFKTGQLTCILGPSGSGKTTLLNVLAHRHEARLPGSVRSGRIFLGAHEIHPFDLQHRLAYVLQVDQLFETETPRECVEFSAALRLPVDVPRDTRMQLVEDVLDALRLTSCAGTHIGSSLKKGISGGERVRTSIAVELVTQSDMLFMDEPLSGLDSHTAFEVVSMLKHFTAGGLPVVCTVHQPSSEVFALFDTVLIVHDGETVFQGPMSQLAAHYEWISLPCPSNFNLADHALSVMFQVPDHHVKACWQTSPAHYQLVQSHNIREIQSFCGSDLEPQTYQVQSTRPGMSCQLKELLLREVRGSLRGAGAVRMRFIQAILVSCIFSLMFFGIAAADEVDEDGHMNCHPRHFDKIACMQAFENHVNAILAYTFYAMIAATNPVITHFPLELPIFLREYVCGTYKVLPYFLAKTLVEIPITLLHVLTFILIVYWMVAFRGPLISMWLGTAFYAMSSVSVAIAISCSMATVDRVNQVAVFVTTFQVLFSGMFLPVEKIPFALRWLEHLVPMRHGIKLLIVNEFDHVNQAISSCEAVNLKTECMQRLGGDYLRKDLLKAEGVVSFDNTTEIVALSCIFVGCRTLAAIFIWRRGR